MEPNKNTLIELTAEIVAAHVANHVLAVAELPTLIRITYDALAKVAAPEPEAAAVELKPAVPIRRSVNPDHLVCLECGAKLKLLKRHLQSDHGLSIEAYRARWKLAADYPTTAPDYARHRSELAVKIGLGQRK